MIYSDYFEHESQSSKWDRVRVDYDLVKRIIKAKEYQAYDESVKANKLRVKKIGSRGL